MITDRSVNFFFKGHNYGKQLDKSEFIKTFNPENNFLSIAKPEIIEVCNQLVYDYLGDSANEYSIYDIAGRTVYANDFEDYCERCANHERVFPFEKEESKDIIEHYWGDFFILKNKESFETFCHMTCSLVLSYKPFVVIFSTWSLDTKKRLKKEKLDEEIHANLEILEDFLDTNEYRTHKYIFRRRNFYACTEWILDKINRMNTMLEGQMKEIDVLKKQNAFLINSLLVLLFVDIVGLLIFIVKMFLM